MKRIIHIRHIPKGWQAKDENGDAPLVVGADKNAIVRRVAEWFDHCTLVIHGLDGRVLEKREIQPKMG